MLEKNTRWSFVLVLCLTLLGLGLIGCGDDDSDNNSSDTTSSGDVSSSSSGDTTSSSSGADMTAPSCGDVTYEGECSGLTLSFCLNKGEVDEELIVRDCGDYYPEGTQAVCIYIAEGYGYDCGVAVGETCTYSSSDTSEPIYAFCEGTDPGCIIDGEGVGTCQENIGVCTLDGEAMPPEFECLESNLAFICQSGQPTAVDCAGSGGTCTAADGTCSAIPAEGACSTDPELGFYVCDEGLTCEGEAGADSGVCVAGQVTECTEADTSACADISCECTSGTVTEKRCDTDGMCVTGTDACFGDATSICGEMMPMPECTDVDATACAEITCACTAAAQTGSFCNADNTCAADTDCFNDTTPADSVCGEVTPAPECTDVDATACAEITCACTAAAQTGSFCNADNTCAADTNCFNDTTPADSVCGEVTPAP